jgi:hypothetical protein
MDASSLRFFAGKPAWLVFRDSLAIKLRREVRAASLNSRKVTLRQSSTTHAARPLEGSEINLAGVPAVRSRHGFGTG